MNYLDQTEYIDSNKVYLMSMSLGFLFVKNLFVKKFMCFAPTLVRTNRSYSTSTIVATCTGLILVHYN